MTAGLIFALACAILAILYGIWQSGRILRLPAGNERMQEISAAVREGSMRISIVRIRPRRFLRRLLISAAPISVFA